jgi:hypothetical protein
MIDPTQSPFLICVVSFVVMWGSARVGSRFGGALKETHEDFGVILTSTLTLLGLIVGFTFSMAVSRYEQRKLYEEQEANAIGTEYARADLLPAPDGDNVRRLLREYLDQRILFYTTRNREQLRRIDADTGRLQARLWEGVRVPSLAEQTPLKMLVVSGMNDVLNSQGYTQAAWWNRIPAEAWVLMGMIAACGNLMVGLYLGGGPQRGKLLLVLPAVVSVSLFLIADIDSPRNGLIHVKPDNLSSVASALRS